MVSIASLFPGNTGRVTLARVAVRLRKPELLEMSPHKELDAELVKRIEQALEIINKG